jgi:hypothetical protein
MGRRGQYTVGGVRHTRRINRSCSWGRYISTGRVVCQAESQSGVLPTPLAITTTKALMCDLSTTTLASFRNLLCAVVLFNAGSLKVMAGNESADFRYGQAAGKYAAAAHSMDWLRRSRCGHLVPINRYLPDAVSDIERRTPATMHTEMRVFLSGTPMAKLQGDVDRTMTSFLGDFTKANGTKVACEVLDLTTKTMYYRAQNEWHQLSK